MTARVCVNLHEQVVGVGLQGVALSLQKIARLEHGVKEEQLVPALAFETGYTVSVGYQVLQKLT